MLVQAFVEEVFDELEDETMREALDARIDELAGAPWLNTCGRAYDVECRPRGFPDPVARWCMASRSSISTMARRRKSRSAVIDAMVHTMENEYANVHRGLHFLSNAATDAYEKAREIVRDFLNAPRVDEVIFTKGATQAINIVAYGWAMANLQRGRRNRAHADGAPFQHRAVAFPARAHGREARLGAGRG